MNYQLLRRLITQQIYLISSFKDVKNGLLNYGCVDGNIIGTGRADYTQGATSYDLYVDNKCFSLIDIPGIEGDESKYESIISDSLDKAHTIFYVNGSGKKIEKDTLTKVKNYMHDGTSVYALFNIHCKAKKERIPGLDPTYAEELADAYRKQQDIINQTEKELISFLGSNYKGSIPLNGLLAFSALAINEYGGTTIVNDNEKLLRSDQRKYFNEYNNRCDYMLNDSNILILDSIIKQKLRNIDSEIYEENIRKLRNRINEMINTVENISSIEEKKLNGFIQTYYEFISKCENAKNDFIYTNNHMASSAVESAFANVRDELYDLVERRNGKVDNSDIENCFNKHKQGIVNQIQKSVNDRLSQALADYEEEIIDAQNRLQKDLEREQLKFQVSLSSSNLSLNGVLGNSLKYTWNDFGKHLFTTGSLAFSGAGIGSLILPGIGTIIGGAVGAVIGVLGSIWNFFASKQKRIDRAKGRIRDAINDIIDDVTEELEKEIKKLNCSKIIETNYNELYNQANNQIASLERIKRLLCTVINELKRKEKMLV